MQAEANCQNCILIISEPYSVNRPYKNTNSVLLIPNRTFLVRFGGISGEFGRTMDRILARRSRAKIPLARPNEPDMLPKRTKKVPLGINRTQIRPKTRGYFFISYRDQSGVVQIL